MPNFQDEVVRVAIARSEMYSEFPRLYRTFDQVDMVIDTTIPTMGVAPVYTKGGQFTGKYDLLWNPKFLKDLTDKQLKGVLLHEILHILLNHTTSRRPELKGATIDSQGRTYSKDEEDMLRHLTWNQATDVAINQMIRDFLQDPASKWKDGLFPETFTPKLPPDKNAEEYYKTLYKQNQQRAKQEKEFLKKLKEELEKNGLDSHSGWIEVDEKGNVVSVDGKPFKADPNAKPLTKEEKEAREKAAEALGKIAEDTHIQGWGTGSETSNQVQLAVGKQKRTPGWMNQTRHASVHGYEIYPQLTRKVPNRRFGLAFPGKRRQTIGNKVLVAVDVSGSIDMPLYQEFSAHLEHLLRFAKFDIIFFNSSLIDNEGRAYEPENAELGTKPFKKGMMCRIGGGTSFEPIMRFYNRVRSRYASLFIFTDGDAMYSTPPARAKEVNWIIYNSSQSYVRGNVKHGNVHFMNRGEYL